MSSTPAVVKKLAKTPKRDNDRKAEDTCTIGARVTNDLYEQVKAFAELLDTTTSKLLAEIIRDGVVKIEKDLRSSSEFSFVSTKTRVKGRTTT